MNDKIQEKLQEIIANEMPKQVGVQLQARLKVADELEIEVDTLRKDLIQAGEDFDLEHKKRHKAEQELFNQKTRKEQIEDLKALQDEHWKRDMEIKLKEQTHEKTEAVKRAEEVKEVVSMFTKNSTYRKSVMENVNNTPGVGHTDMNGQWIEGHPMGVITNSEETTTEE